MKERVTWLLPVRNGMPYLPETLATIAAQTYTDWEILAWDNGSTDGTLEELQRWIPSRLPGRVVSGRPLPLGACLAAMVEEANTELCARIDADDLNLPDRLEKQVRYLQQHPEVALVGGQSDFIDSQGQPHPKKERRYQTTPEGVYYGMLITCTLWHPTVLFRKQCVLEAGNYRDRHELVRIEDYDMWLRLITRYPVANLPDVVLRYRLHEGSVTQIAKAKANLLREIQWDVASGHAATTFGITAEEIQAVQQFRCKDGLKVMEKVAAHAVANIPWLRGRTVESIKQTPDWQEACRWLIPASDIKQRLQLARRYGNGPVEVAREVVRIAQAAQRSASRRSAASKGAVR